MTIAPLPRADGDWVRDPDDRQAADLLRPFVRHPLDLNVIPPPPPKLNRFLYGAGALTAVISQPGVGKSLLLNEFTRGQLEEGHSVVVFDEEGGSELTTERHIALGTDPQAVLERLHYFPFEDRRWNADDLEALTYLVAGLHDCSLVVFDSLPDFLAAAGRSEDSAQDVTWFVNTVLRPFRRAGISQVVLDHLLKDKGEARKRSRFSRGSGAKLAKADATLLLETAEEFDVHRSGALNVWKTKDRRGRLEVPDLSKPPLRILVDVDHGRITFTEAEPVERDPWNGPTECMAIVEQVLRQAAPTELSGRRLCEIVRAEHPFRDATIREAAELLALKDGPIRARQGARNSTMYGFMRTSR